MSTDALGTEFPSGKDCPLCRGGLNEWGHTQPCYDVRGKLAALETALRKLRPYFGKLEAEPRRPDSLVGPGTSYFDAAREAFAVLRVGEEQSK